jgi:hypothetical protein
MAASMRNKYREGRKDGRDEDGKYNVNVTSNQKLRVLTTRSHVGRSKSAPFIGEDQKGGFPIRSLARNAASLSGTCVPVIIFRFNI